MTETIYTVTLPRALRTALADSDPIEGLAAEPGRAGSLKVTGTADALLDLHDRLWIFEGGEGVDTSPAERSAYRRWSAALRLNGFRL